MYTRGTPITEINDVTIKTSKTMVVDEPHSRPVTLSIKNSRLFKINPIYTQTVMKLWPWPAIEPYCFIFEYIDFDQLLYL